MKSLAEQGSVPESSSMDKGDDGFVVAKVEDALELRVLLDTGADLAVASHNLLRALQRAGKMVPIGCGDTPLELQPFGCDIVLSENQLTH